MRQATESDGHAMKTAHDRSNLPLVRVTFRKVKKEPIRMVRVSITKAPEVVFRRVFVTVKKP
jgi:hypothetical protein